MRKLRIIHTADLHLDSPYEALGIEKAKLRREEQWELLHALVSLAEREHADLMLLAGDLLDSWKGYHETGELLARCLADVPCPVLISPGSHDFYSPGSPYARVEFPENVHIFEENRIQLVSVPSADCRVFGAAFTERTCAPLLQGFHADRKEGFYNLLCMHGEATASSLRNPISPDDLAASGIDYAALGGVHAASGLLKSGSCAYSWPGCPEGHCFAEAGEKTVNIAELSPDGCSLRTVPIAARHYRAMTLDISARDPLLLIHTSLPDDSFRDIYRIMLTGISREAPDLRKLHQNLDELFFALQLEDNTRLPEDIWAFAGEDSLRGLFLSKMRTLLDAADSADARMRVEKAVRWGLAALNDAGEVVSHENT